MVATSKDHLKVGEKFIGRIDTPYGAHLINRGDALDHARMRSTQLTSLILLIQGEGDMAVFKTLREDLQDSLVWLALQTSQELGAAIELVADDAREDQARPAGVDGLPPDQRQLLGHYAKLSDSARSAVVDTAQCFTENPDNLRPAPGDAS